MPVAGILKAIIQKHCAVRNNQPDKNIPFRAGKDSIMAPPPPFSNNNLSIISDLHIYSTCGHSLG